jgi:hypothetical protein
MNRLPYDGMREAARIEATSIALDRLQREREAQQAAAGLSDEQRTKYAAWGVIEGPMPPFAK